ncbi:hypothetical protein [Corynebacterium pelargi]|uniref:Uncharacterized protein n=1 Tax=Corynebacterium pelargi TaxID=1471400 RepID=A0A410WBQ7_9CORY|nr:hypothetical protein [Corynebacterium pelargi]QAU53382.1 hypothetical protein CPELA_10700 [Corynebacterium pelargi]GGG72882.1 hypothetical protein GCM10007338_07530 [Corynebacterium pelargi]
MSDPVMWFTIASVFFGFALFCGAFLCYSTGKSQKLTWTLFSVAVVFITLIPVGLAVGVSAG